jgi:hypothetical protein
MQMSYSPAGTFGFSQLFRGFFASVIIVSLIAPPVSAAPKPTAPKPAKRKKWAPAGELDQDFPYTTACVGASFPTGNKAYKGIAIKLGNDAYMCFDTDLLRMSAGWTGNYLNFVGVTFNGSHGDHPTIAGDQKFGTKMLPGVAEASGEFVDPRTEKFGPVPERMGRWNGL